MFEPLFLVTLDTLLLLWDFGLRQAFVASWLTDRFFGLSTPRAITHLLCFVFLLVLRLLGYININSVMVSLFGAAHITLIGVVRHRIVTLQTIPTFSRFLYLWIFSHCYGLYWPMTWLRNVSVLRVFESVCSTTPRTNYVLHFVSVIAALTFPVG